MEENFIKQLQGIIKKQKAKIFQLKSIIENLPGSIYWKDKNGVYVGHNNYAVEKLQSVNLDLKGKKNIIIGKTDYDLFSKEIADSYRRHDLKVIENKKELSVEESAILPNGKTIIQLSTKKPLYNEEGEVIGIIGNTIDITHLKDKAEQADIITTEFMRNMEHDIRTPFSGVLGMIKCLGEIEEDQKKKKYLNDIADCAQELLDYCNNILEFSKIEADIVAVISRKFNFEKLISSIIKIELPAAIYKNLSLDIISDPNIPTVLIGDAYRVQCILINILSNAIKFTQQGSVELNISLLQKNKKDVLIRFIVKDTGIGIPSDKQEYIFERFSKLSLSNRGFYKGVGVGLRVVKKFMHEIGGEIDLLSEVGLGTQFICTIPFDLPLTNDFVEK